MESNVSLLVPLLRNEIEPSKLNRLHSENIQTFCQTRSTQLLYVIILAVKQQYSCFLTNAIIESDFSGLRLLQIYLTSALVTQNLSKKIKIIRRIIKTIRDGACNAKIKTISRSNSIQTSDIDCNRLQYYFSTIKYSNKISILH